MEFPVRTSCVILGVKFQALWCHPGKVKEANRMTQFMVWIGPRGTRWTLNSVGKARNEL